MFKKLKISTITNGNFIPGCIVDDIPTPDLL